LIITNKATFFKALQAEIERNGPMESQAADVGTIEVPGQAPTAPNGARLLAKNEQKKKAS